MTAVLNLNLELVAESERLYPGGRWDNAHVFFIYFWPFKSVWPSFSSKVTVPLNSSLFFPQHLYWAPHYFPWWMRIIVASKEAGQRIAKNVRWPATKSSPPTRGNASRQGVVSYLHALVLTVGSTENYFKPGFIPGQIDTLYGAGEQPRFRECQKRRLAYPWLWSILTFQQPQTSSDLLHTTPFK